MPSLPSPGLREDHLATLPIPTGIGGRRTFDDFRGRIGAYHTARDYPALRCPLPAHGTALRHRLAQGTGPRRRCPLTGDPATADGARGWLNQPIWREFYFQVLLASPACRARGRSGPSSTASGGCDDESLFRAWCATHPAIRWSTLAMAQINGTGWMHNRLRMVVAPCPDQGPWASTWRRGERYFADRLNDYDLVGEQRWLAVGRVQRR
jgi:deoxyribodipyrimidine photo-lyase